MVNHKDLEGLLKKIRTTESVFLKEPSGTNAKAAKNAWEVWAKTGKTGGMYRESAKIKTKIYDMYIKGGLGEKEAVVCIKEGHLPKEKTLDYSETLTPPEQSEEYLQSVIDDPYPNNVRGHLDQEVPIEFYEN